MACCEACEKKARQRVAASPDEEIPYQSPRELLAAGFHRSIGVQVGESYRRGREHVRLYQGRAYRHIDKNDPYTLAHAMDVLTDIRRVLGL